MFPKSKVTIEIELPEVPSCELRLFLLKEALQRFERETLRYMSVLYEGDQHPGIRIQSSHVVDPIVVRFKVEKGESK